MKLNSLDPPFGHVANLVARHKEENIAKKSLATNGRRAWFRHEGHHRFEELQALVAGRSTMPSSTLCSAEDAGSGAWPSGGCEEPSAISRAFAAPSNILAIAGVARGLAAQHGIEG